MNMIFIGGSRRVARLPVHATERLNNIIESGFPVLVGDANGADKAVQKYLLDAGYERVTVFCSGDTCRNNLGRWKTANVKTAKEATGFQFYAAKDREMAREANFGLMIWDGKSPGTILNILRLVRAGKKAVLINAVEKTATTFKAADDWNAFLSRCSPELRRDLQERDPGGMAAVLAPSVQPARDDAPRASASGWAAGCATYRSDDEVTASTPRSPPPIRNQAFRDQHPPVPKPLPGIVMADGRCDDDGATAYSIIASR